MTAVAVITAIARSSQPSWIEASPKFRPASDWVTSDWGRRSISNRLIPPSRPIVGSRTWSERRPASTSVRWAATRAPR